MLAAACHCPPTPPLALRVCLFLHLHRCAALQVQLLLGRLPSPALVAAHGLQQYEPIIIAMRNGDIKLFNDIMDAQQFRFIQEVSCPPFRPFFLELSHGQPAAR